MKKLNYLLSLLVVVGMAFTFTSCEDETDPVGPSITLVSETGYISADATIEPGTELMFKVDVRKGDANLDKLAATKDGSPIADSPYEDIDNAADVVEIIINAPAEAGAYGYKFEVTDKDGEFASVTVTVTIEEAGTAFTEEVTTGKVFHVLAPEMASWNLAADEAISSSSSDDIIYIQNADEAGAFTGKFQSKNSTGFVKVTLDYATATVEEATAAYTSSATTVDAPAADDVYVAMKGSELYLIKITDINTTDGTSTAGNTGSMSFSYKK